MHLSQTLAHHVYILYVDEEDLALFIMVLALVASTGASISHSVDLGPGVDYEELVEGVVGVQLVECVQIGLVALVLF